MRLRVLGGLALESVGLNRPKPLLLLAYLAVEGAKEKRHLYELFWPEAADPATSLRMVLSQLRKAAPQVIQADERTLSTPLESDLAELHKAIAEGDIPVIEALYGGGFLAGFSLPDWGAELEEWVYSTREFVARGVKSAFLRAAEAEAAKGVFDLARRWAEKAYQLGRQDPTLEDLERLYKLLVAGNSTASGEVKQQAADYGLELNLTAQEAQQHYYATPLEITTEPIPKALSHNLPRPKTSFVGRDPELVELGRILRQGEVRLLTLLGPGGVGKTRLALQLAAAQLQEETFSEGIYFVALEALEEPQQMPLALAQALGIKVKDDPIEAVQAGIGGRRILLVLDNFEQLIEGALAISDLLEACPNLNIIVTSRERLNLEEEFVLGLQGLPLPHEQNLEFSRLEYNDAVRLFVQRAKRARLDFTLTPENLPHVLGICRFVEGSPLGIELAAVWLRSLPVAEIAQEIGRIMDGLEAPTRNLAGRHQSLRVVFEHSWKLLKPKEQQTLAQLTVFIDGFTREAAGQVADATIPLLTSLVDKSLLRVSAEGRYDFHPLLYQYAGEKLIESELQGPSKARHAHYFLALIETSSALGVEAYVKCAKEEHQNLLAALAWSQEASQPLIGLRLADALSLFWETQGYISQARQWLETVLSHPGASAPTEARARVLIGAANHAISQAAYGVAQTYLEQALALSQALGLAERAAQAFLLLSLVAIQSGDPNQAQKYAEEALALARKLEDDELIAQSLVHLAAAAAGHHDYQQAQTLTEQSIALFRRLGLQFHLALKLNNLGCWRWLLGDLQAAKAHLEEAVAIAQSLPDLPTLCLARSNLGGVLLDLGEFVQARTLAHQALEFRHAQNDRWGLAYSLENFACLAVVLRDARSAARLWGAAERLRQEINAPMFSLWQTRYERFVGLAKGQLDEAGFGLAWRQGRGMAPEEAVQLAQALTLTEPIGVSIYKPGSRGR